MESEFRKTLHESIVDGLRQVIGNSDIRTLPFDIESAQQVDDLVEWPQKSFSKRRLGVGKRIKGLKGKSGEKKNNAQKEAILLSERSG